jgi:tRNA-specific 2-thiouridylase
MSRGIEARRGEPVLVAMSGGVDSAVAAALLLDAGHEVVGVTMRLWGGESDTGCCSIADVDDARRVADHLGIDHHVFNFTDDFAADVVEPYVRDHAEGRTPNPCIECNRHLKFGRLLRRADQLGFPLVATGHHARVVRRPDGRSALHRGADTAKDQSYVLGMLDHTTLERVLFPVGDLTKDEVRAEAERRGLRTAAKPDSQDVCFITRSESRAGFLGRRIPLHEGVVVDAEGHELARVPAVELVTIGQRRRLGLGGEHLGLRAVEVDIPRRRVVVGTPDELLRHEQVLESVTWAYEPVEGPVRAQVSAHAASVSARVELGPGSSVRVVWETPERRVAPGQTVVLYDPVDVEVMGSGIAV